MSAKQPSNGVIRLDFSSYQLFYLAFLRIYVATSYRTVASYFNRSFDVQPRLRTKDCYATYLDLHDSKHESWVRARNMNKEEPELLKIMMEVSGLPRRRWDADFIHPVGPMGCYRVLD
ncbi:MAG: hypothetical protein Q9196_000171 [Gyalolechia fulgens]